jgi:phosphoribosylformylglycinamidine (FGAM) synthase-like amidotransferase family enzyme
MKRFEVFPVPHGEGWLMVASLDQEEQEDRESAALFRPEYREEAQQFADRMNGVRRSPTRVYRILDDGGQACTSTGHPDRYGVAIFTNLEGADRAIRWLNDPVRLADGSPQPAGRPYHRQDGEIHWRANGE